MSQYTTVYRYPTNGFQTANHETNGNNLSTKNERSEWCDTHDSCEQFSMTYE